MVSVGIGRDGVLSEAWHVFRDFTEIEISFIDRLLEMEPKLYQ